MNNSDNGLTTIKGSPFNLFTIKYFPLKKESTLFSIFSMTNNFRSEYTSFGQELWNIFSNETINLLTFKLQSGECSLENILRNLGDARSIIASILQNGPTNTLEKYGCPYKYKLTPICDTVYNDSEITAHLQLYQRMEKICNAMVDKKILMPLSTKTNVLNTLPTAINKYLNSEIKNKKNCFFSISEIKTNLTSQKASIFYEKEHFIHFSYNQLNFDEIIEKWQEDFLNLLLSPANNLECFIESVGGFVYELFRSLPFELGSSAIIEWLARAILRAKGIELGKFGDLSNQLPSVDFLAFITPDPNEFKKKFRMAYPEVSFFKSQEIFLAENQCDEDFIPKTFGYIQTLNSNTLSETQTMK